MSLDSPNRERAVQHVFNWDRAAEETPLFGSLSTWKDERQFFNRKRTCFQLT